MEADIENIVKLRYTRRNQYMNIPPLKQTLPPLLRRHGVSVAYLFGSQAHGRVQADSDIDLAVAFPKDYAAAKQTRCIAQLMSAVSKANDGRLVDIINLHNQLPPLLKHRAVFSGQRILNDNPSQSFQIEQQARHAYEDTQYLRATQYRLLHQRIVNGTFGQLSQTEY